MKRYFTIFIMAWAASSSLFFWQPRYQLLNAIEQAIAASLPAELLNAFADLNANSEYPQALNYLLGQHNQGLQSALSLRQGATIKQCSALISTTPAEQPVSWDSINRPISLQILGKTSYFHLSLSCTTHWPALISYSLLLSAGLVAVVLFLPKPFSRRRRYWLNRLITDGLPKEQAIAVTEPLDQHPKIDDSVFKPLDQLYDKLNNKAHHNFSKLLQHLQDYPIANFDKQQLAWFSKALEAHPVEEAVQIAQSPDTLVIDLAEASITAHGWLLPLPKTPLFYYAFYAHLRGQDDGWYMNPQSNKPDKALGNWLAECMSCYGGHAKAIGDLEDTGLKSKVLDQNRSKIKDEITQHLGEKLASPYLFESSDNEGIRKKYRLSLSPEQIDIRDPLNCLRV